MAILNRARPFAAQEQGRQMTLRGREQPQRTKRQYLVCTYLTYWFYNKQAFRKLLRIVIVTGIYL